MYNSVYGTGLYYGFTIFIVSLATALTVMTLNIHHHGSSGHPVPPLVRRLCFRWLRRLLCLGVNARMRHPRQTLQDIVEVNKRFRGRRIHVQKFHGVTAGAVLGKNIWGPDPVLPSLSLPLPHPFPYKQPPLNTRNGVLC